MISEADPGLSGSVWTLLMTLERYGLISRSDQELPTARGTFEAEYEITPYGDWFRERLTGPDPVTDADLQPETGGGEPP